MAILGRVHYELTPPERPGQFCSSSFYSNVRHCQLFQWKYRDSEGRVYSGIATSHNKARAAAEKESGEKIVEAPEGPA